MSLVTTIEPKEIFIELPHITLAALQWGDGKTIRLGLHGWLDNAMSFAPIAPYLIDDEHSLLVLDFAGHGHSEHRPVGSGYFFTDYMRDTMLVIEHFGWQNVDMVAHSMGASVTTLLAGIFTEQFKRIVCIECFAPPFVSDHVDMIERMRERLTRLEYVHHQSQTIYPAFDTLVKARIQAGRLNWDDAAMIVARNVEQVEGGYRFINDRRLRMAQPLLTDEGQMLTYIENIQAPILVIEGEEGYMRNWPHVRARYQHARDIEVVNIKDGGHHPHMDFPQVVAEHIHAFWQRTELDRQQRSASESVREF